MSPLSRFEATRLLRLSWPLVLAHLGWMIMGVVDTLMLGGLGPEALAAGMLGHTWSFSLLVFGRGAIAGLDPIITQAHGAKDEAAFDEAMATGAVLALLLALPLMALHFLAGTGLAWMGQPEELTVLAGAYAVAVGWGSIPMMFETLLRQGLQAREIMRPGMWAMLVGNVVNVPANLVLIHGWGPIPGLGAVGAGWSTTLVRVCILAALVAYAWGDVVGLVGRIRTVTRARLRRVAGIALPVGAQQALEGWGFSLSTIVVGWAGTSAVAAHTVAMQLSATAFMVPLGLSGGAATRVGNLVGAGLDWRPAAWTSAAVGTAVMVGSGTLFLAAPLWLASSWTDDPDTLATAVTLLRIAAGFSLFDGCQVVCFGVLRGLGDTAMPTWVNVIGFYLLGLPLGAVLAHGAAWGAIGVWVGLTLGLFSVSCMLLLRIRWLARVGVRTRLA